MKGLILLIICLVLGGPHGFAFAYDIEATRSTLRGLQGVHVVVKELDPPEMEQDGLHKDQLQAYVELRLTLAGIKVLTEEEYRETPGAPVLLVRVLGCTHSRLMIYGVSVSLELYQKAVLERELAISALASTWSVHQVNLVGRKRVRQIRDSVKDCLDRFINAYMSVNPK